MKNSDSLPWTNSNAKENSLHAMCSYLGSFPAGLARTFIELLSEPGNIVLDPFCGRGTTLLETRLARRIPLASDLNPVALALTSAKNVCVSYDSALDRIDNLEANYDIPLFLPEALDQPEDIKLIFHPYTLAQLCYMRRILIKSANDTDKFLVGMILGLMHGKERKDGSSAYASISMPNTFSMSPGYVRRFVQRNNLQKIERNVFKLLREKVFRLNSDLELPVSKGIVACADAKTLSSNEELALYKGKVDLIITSPPYGNIVNYALQNWIRMWFLSHDARLVSDILDDGLTLGASLDFLEQAISELKKMLSSKGVIVMVVGDIAKSTSSVVSPARDLIRRIHNKSMFKYIGFISDYLDINTKTTRIWGNSKGRATNVDRIILLSDSEFCFNPDNELSKQFNTSKLIENAIEFAGL